MDEEPQGTDEERDPDSTYEGLQRDDETVGADEPVGADNIREGKVRGTMHGGPTHQGGQGQGG